MNTFLRCSHSLVASVTRASESLAWEGLHRGLTECYTSTGCATSPWTLFLNASSENATQCPAKVDSSFFLRLLEYICRASCLQSLTPSRAGARSANSGRKSSSRFLPASVLVELAPELQRKKTSLKLLDSSRVIDSVRRYSYFVLFWCFF